MKIVSLPVLSRPAKLASVALFLFLGVVASRSFAATYDFEAATATSMGTTTPGAYTSLILVDSGLTMTLSREGGSTFDILDWQTTTHPADWGNHSLDPFSDTSSSAFVANFSQALTGFSLEFGDFGGDRDKLTLQAFSGLDGTGTLLGSVSVAWNGSLGAGDAAAIASLTGLSGIQSVVFIGGSRSYPNSFYYDNFTAYVTNRPVPEGGSSLLLLGLALVTMLGAGGVIARPRPAVSGGMRRG